MSARPIATTRSTAGMPTGKLAVWWVVASEIVIFGGLLASYIMLRIAHEDWGEQAAHTNTWIGAFNTLVLLTSSLSAVLAHKAATEGNGPKAARLLWFTILGAATFAFASTAFAANIVDGPRVHWDYAIWGKPRAITTATHVAAVTPPCLVGSCVRSSRSFSRGR